MTMVANDIQQIPALIAQGASEIVLKSGCYFADNSILLENAAGVKIRGEDGVRIIGGRRLSGAVQWKDGIYRINLSENGVFQTGEFHSRGFARPVVPSHSEVFVNTRPLNLSQYPKRGKYLTITGFETPEGDEGWGATNGKLSDGFYYDDERPSEWEKSGDIWVHGYWAYDWANSYEQVDALDSKRKFVRNKPPYGNYQFHTGQRFCFLNILEEVTEKGDYYIDKKQNMLYFIPYEGEDFDEILISLLQKPVFTLSGCSDIAIENLTIEASCAGAITAANSDNIHIKNCHIRNMGNYGIVLNHCKNSSVCGCVIHDNGDGGISAEGGNRATLERADILILNNHIYNIAKWTRCYQTAANITGVGITVDHNEIHDCPHTAVLYWGNDITITNNEIYRVVMETGDAGAVYSGRDYTCRGNVVSGNYIHHLGGVGMGTMGIYNDDCLSGTVMEDNFFYECSRAVFLGGGRDFVVRNNVFVNCYPAVSVDGRGTSEHRMWRSMVDGTLRERFYNIAGGHAAQNDTKLTGVKSPYIDRYPELADIDAFYRNGEKIPHILPSARIENNVFCSKREIELDWDTEKGDFIIHNNFSCTKDDFMDYAAEDFTLKETSAALSGGVKRNNIKNCGLLR